MEEQRKVIITVIAFIVTIAVGIGIYFFLIASRSKQAEPVQEVIQETPVVHQPAEERPPVPLDVKLDESDDVIRRLLTSLSANTMLAEWLKNDDLIRKFVATVDNIAHGQTPRSHLSFFKPKGGFAVVEEEGSFSTDPQAYHRYDIVADVFVSLDTGGVSEIYPRLKPVFQQAYQELGYPEQDFHEALIAAMAELLEVPVVEEDLALMKDVKGYTLTDPQLESLSQAQKHLLRMGPENVRKIQSRLRNLARALKIPADRLPAKN